MSLSNDTPLVFEGDDPNRLDEIYLGCKLGGLRWDVAIMAPPKITDLGFMEQTDFTKSSMQSSANWGYILKIGSRAFEEMINLKPTKPKNPIYKPGQLVYFEEYHHQSRNENGVMIYYISDARLIRYEEEPELCGMHLLVKDQFPIYRERAKEWMSLSKEERKKKAQLQVLADQF